jgi:hypothetical protein
MPSSQIHQLVPALMEDMQNGLEKKIKNESLLLQMVLTMGVDVVYFDYWTRGIRHFIKIDQNVKARGLSSLLVHLGSQRGEPLTENQELNGIQCADIIQYDGSLIRMLKKERPKVVLLLNNQTEDKIIVRACRNLNIKTVFLMHGVLTPEDKLHQYLDLVDSSFGINDRVRRIPKYIWLFWQYLDAALLGGVLNIFDREIYAYFARQAYSPGGNLAGKWKYRDSCADIALVYSEEDRSLFASCFGYDTQNILVVGNYNLDELFENKLIHRDEVTLSGDAEKNIVYIENGFSDPKYIVPGWSEDLVADEVENISRVCDDFGYKLKLKLHPSSDYSTLIERLRRNSNIEIIWNCDLAELIVQADIVLGQSSSVLMMALAVGKPIFLLDMSPLNLKITMYADRGFGEITSSLGKLRDLLSRRADPGFASAYPDTDKVGQFVGPFDGQASNRISSVIMSQCIGRD